MKQSFKNIALLALVMISMFSFVHAQTSTLVSIDGGGKLVYAADAKGNKVPDFSGVGYNNSERPISC